MPRLAGRRSTKSFQPAPNLYAQYADTYRALGWEVIAVSGKKSPFKGTTGRADAAALAGADGFTLTVDASGPAARLTDAGVYDQAEELLAATQTAELVAASTPDGVSARVTVATTWRPPVLTLFVPDGWPLESTATSRTALR